MPKTLKMLTMTTKEESLFLCRSCKEHLPLKSFWKRKRNASGISTQCTSCAKSRPGYEGKSEKNKKYYNPEYHQGWHYRTQYGISLEDVKAMAEKQNNCCAICGTHADNTPKKKLNVDHSHVTGKVRKLLCHHCNVTLGLIKEDRTILARMDQYLKDHDQWLP